MTPSQKAIARVRMLALLTPEQLILRELAFLLEVRERDYPNAGLYTWASQQYFAARIGFSVPTVKRAFRRLRRRRMIRVIRRRKPGGDYKTNLVEVAPWVRELLPRRHPSKTRGLNQGSHVIHKLLCTEEKEAAPNLAAASSSLPDLREGAPRTERDLETPATSARVREILDSLTRPGREGGGAKPMPEDDFEPVKGPTPRQQTEALRIPFRLKLQEAYRHEQAPTDLAPTPPRRTKRVAGPRRTAKGRRRSPT